MSVKYPVDWNKVADATKVLLDLPEMNLDKRDPQSLMHEPIIVERKFCPDCKCYVQAEVSFYNPDNHDEGLIWQCLQCGCAIEFLDE